METAVRSIHIPTSLSVRCEEERSQAQNKTKAKEWLILKLSATMMLRKLKPSDRYGAVATPWSDVMQRKLSKEIMKNWLKTFIIEHTLPFKHIQYLHPEGKSMPNGIYYQRGYYCKVCADNAQKFTIRNNNDEIVVPPCNKGCVVVFPSGRNITFTNNKYFHGNFFEGSYIGRDEEKYGVGSMCIYIDDKSTKESIKFAKALASENSIHHILVKYLDTNQIFRGDF